MEKQEQMGSVLILKTKPYLQVISWICMLFFSAVPFVAVFGNYYSLVQDGGSLPQGVGPWLRELFGPVILTPLIISTFVVGASLLLLEEAVRVTDKCVILKSRGRSINVPFSDVKALWLGWVFFPSITQKRLLIIETKSGNRHYLWVDLSLYCTQAVQAVQDAIAAGTGCLWQEEKRTGNGFGALAKVRGAIGAKSRGAFLRWVLVNGTFIWPENFNLSDRFINFSVTIFSPLVLISALFFLPSTVDGVPVLVYLLFVLFLTNFGGNVLAVLLVGENQKRNQLRSQIHAAREVQKHLLPKKLPESDAYAMAFAYEAAQEVGGDYVGLIDLDDQRTACVVADVSGKGLSAGMAMSLVKGFFIMGLKRRGSMQERLAHINHQVRTWCLPNTFVSAAVLVLDRAEHRIHLFRAGHNPPLFFSAKDGACRWLDPPGLALGIAGGDMFSKVMTEQVLPMEPGDLVVLYTDGLTETFDEMQTAFGEDRLLRLVMDGDRQNPEAVKGNILDAVRAFRGNCAPDDDLTMLVVQRVP